MAKSTLTQLIAKVSALIDIQVSSSTTPSIDNITGWLNEGAIQIFRLFPVEEFRDSMIYLLKRNNGDVNQDDFTKRLMKIVAVYKDGVYCTKITEEEMGSLENSRPLKFNYMQPAYCRVSSSGNHTVIKTYPPIGTSGKIEVTYLPYPFEYNSATPTATPDNTGVPVSLEGYLVEYAAILARIQDEEPGQFQLYMQDWRSKIQMAHGLPVESVEGNL